MRPSTNNSKRLSTTQPSQPPMGTNTQRGNTSLVEVCRGLSRRAARAGLSVSELNAEMIVELAMVRANCRKNCPVRPLMKAHGTNTADSTRPTATTGPATRSIAAMAASRGGRPSSR